MNDYVGCIYDKWWIGKVLEVSEESYDWYIQFCYPYGSKTSFQLSKNYNLGTSIGN